VGVGWGIKMTRLFTKIHSYCIFFFLGGGGGWGGVGGGVYLHVFRLSLPFIRSV
jgi:hypothetical protein